MTKTVLPGALDGAACGRHSVFRLQVDHPGVGVGTLDAGDVTLGAEEGRQPVAEHAEVQARAPLGVGAAGDVAIQERAELRLFRRRRGQPRRHQPGLRQFRVQAVADVSEPGRRVAIDGMARVQGRVDSLYPILDFGGRALRDLAQPQRLAVAVAVHEQDTAAVTGIVDDASHESPYPFRAGHTARR